MDLHELLNPTGSPVDTQPDHESSRLTELFPSVDSNRSLNELPISSLGRTVRDDMAAPYLNYLSRGYLFPPPSTAHSSASDESNTGLFMNSVEQLTPDLYSRSLPRIQDLTSNESVNEENIGGDNSSNMPLKLYSGLHSVPDLRSNSRQIYHHHRKTSSWISFDEEDIDAKTACEGSERQKGTLLPNRQLRSPRRVVEGRVYNGCQYTVHCDNRAPLRKVVSHIFGRNKRQTLSIPKHIWVYMCRKHYQREAYRKDSYPVIQAALVAEQVERFDIWGRVLDFQVRYGKVIYRRFNMGEVKRLVRAITNVLRNNMENKVLLRMSDTVMEEVSTVTGSSSNCGVFRTPDSENQQESSLHMPSYAHPPPPPQQQQQQHHHRRVTGDEDSYRFLDSLQNLATPVSLTLDESRQMVHDLLSTASRGCVSRQHSDPSLSLAIGRGSGAGSDEGQASGGLNPLTTSFAFSSAGTLDPDQLTVYPVIEILPNVMT